MAQNIWITNMPQSVIPHAERGRVIADVYSHIHTL